MPFSIGNEINHVMGNADLSFATQAFDLCVDHVVSEDVSFEKIVACDRSLVRREKSGRHELAEITPDDQDHGLIDRAPKSHFFSKGHRSPACVLAETSGHSAP